MTFDQAARAFTEAQQAAPADPPVELSGPNRFLVDLVHAANARGWIVGGWRNGKVVELDLHAFGQAVRGHAEITLRSDYGVGLEELIAQLPRGDDVPT